MMRASAPSPVVYAEADAALESRLRDEFLGRPGVAYAGRDFRIYAHMRVGDAVRFYAAIHRTWNGAQLADDLVAAGLGEAFEVRRLKRTYQRALVLAFAAATMPELLVVEGAEEFDEERAIAFLDRAIARVPRTILTYAAPVASPAAAPA